MSKQRSISIRKSDNRVIEAFEIALVQLGVLDFATGTQMPYVTITGNKEEGVVQVETLNNHARVYNSSKSELFSVILRVEFDVLDGVVLDKPKIVNFNVGDLHMLTITSVCTQLLPVTVYRLVGMAYGFDTATTVLLYMWKYPLVQSDGSNECALSYKFGPDNSDGVCGVRSIELQYNSTYGFTQAVINGNRRFVCEPFTYIWREYSKE